MLLTKALKQRTCWLACLWAATSHLNAFAEDDNSAVVAAKSSTIATTQLINSFSTSSFLGAGPILSYRLGEITSRSQAAGDDSEFESTSFSVTPTIATINNRIEPILLDGRVSLVILGVEKFDEIDLVAKGITLTLDQTSVTSTQRVTGVADSSTNVTGYGFTVAPYYVVQLESGRLMDFNVGIGKNNLKTRAASTTAEPISDRAFASVGTSTVTPLKKNSYIQYKASLGYTYDGVDQYAQSDGTVVSKSVTRLTQATAGATYTQRFDTFSPYVGVTLVHNSLSTSGSGTQPREYSSTVLVKTGVNYSNDFFYGTISVQGERGKTSIQAYAGLRF